jgi:muramoyltetrapeptide carboxypeptidase LdcA involved in peptidoglycan recycling
MTFKPRAQFSSWKIVAAKPYQIDRMLMQLKLAGKFKDVQGIIFGEMLDCRQSPDPRLHAGRSRTASD